MQFFIYALQFYKYFGEKYFLSPFVYTGSSIEPKPKPKKKKEDKTKDNPPKKKITKKTNKPKTTTNNRK